MTLAQIRDWLKTFDVAGNYYIGRLDNKLERSLGVYDRARKGPPVIALGGAENSSYDVKAVRLLLHWNRNADQTEAAARALWDAVVRAAHIDLPDDGHIQFVRPAAPAPRAVGTDAGGVYEYIIDLDIYFRR